MGFWLPEEGSGSSTTRVVLTMNGTRKDYDSVSRTEVEDLVRVFLDSPQRQSLRGGFAEVHTEDKEDLDDLIRALVKYRYAPDPDGDRPIRWQLCDWTKQEPHNFINLPHAEEDDSNIEARLDLALLNLAMAHEAVQGIQRMRNFLKIERPKEGSK